ncbi:MAG: TIGR01212 family radical SAM protein [Muribaculaceae bacterium]|nr:TIGR01212 family radical SAM protein [Muribaculaceae bacterium]
MNPWYTDYSEYIQKFFPGKKVQKISVNTGGSCPNRDGTISRGGCIYCNNSSFTPGYCMSGLNITEQIEQGRRFFGRKYKDMRWLVYFQSYTTTHGYGADMLEEMISAAMEAEDVEGVVIGTRPDCLPDDTLAVLAGLNRKKPLFVELGVETLNDETLRLINRGHSSTDSESAIRRLAHEGIHVGTHLIMGLPGETCEDMLATVDKICRLPVDSIKFHHLQILKNTPLNNKWLSGEIELKLWGAEEYLDFCVKLIKRVPRHVAIERFTASAPPELVAAPKWGLKNYEFVNKLLNKIANSQPENIKEN